MAESNSERAKRLRKQGAARSRARREADAQKEEDADPFCRDISGLSKPKGKDKKSKDNNPPDDTA